jgi:hypothetical protein
VIGHDPRLRESLAVAKHAFFADLFFKPIPTRGSDLAKYGLARATYGYISELTSYRYTAEQLLLTNLCNSRLRAAPKGRVVLIPQDRAEDGLVDIERLLRRAKFELIFAMSEQVNYWLHALRFCFPLTDFAERAAPKVRGLSSDTPYYDPVAPKAFQSIAFRRHETRAGIPLFPIVHVRSWPLKGPFKKAYSRLYSACISELKVGVA